VANAGGWRLSARGWRLSARGSWLPFNVSREVAAPPSMSRGKSEEEGVAGGSRWQLAAGGWRLATPLPTSLERLEGEGRGL
jgi:hypothetical protein